MKNKSNHQPRISARSVEVYQSIFDRLQKLPDQIFEQVSNAEILAEPIGHHIFIDFTEKFTEKATVYVPKDVTHIEDKGDYFEISSPSFVFRQKKTNSKFTFSLI